MSYKLRRMVVYPAYNLPRFQGLSQQKKVRLTVYMIGPLGIHNMLERTHYDEVYLAKHGWTVVDLNTGRQIADFPLQNQAFKFARQVRDWLIREKITLVDLNDMYAPEQVERRAHLCRALEIMAYDNKGVLV